MILACDVGGTKTNVALLDRGAGGLRVVRLETFPSREHPSLHSILDAFLGPQPPRLEAAGFGVAGPVIGNRVETTNLPWKIGGPQLAAQLGLPGVSLLNDVEVQAWSIPVLGAEAQVTLKQGSANAGNIAVIAAGTGLGMAALLRGDGLVRSLASEGGHADFAPIDDIEIELLRTLRRRFGRVSAERVLSGPGLVNIFQFLRDVDAHPLDPRLDEALRQGDPAAAVSEAALKGTSLLAERAVLIFLGIYGAIAGNWALSTVATGGVWLGGGIAHKLFVGPADTSTVWRARAVDRFTARFTQKGRLGPLLVAMPVQLIVSDEAPLLGAAQFALAEAAQEIVPGGWTKLPT